MSYTFSPHIAIQVGLYAEALDFFERVLGLEVLSRGERESHLRAGGMNFYLEDRGGGPASKTTVFFEFSTGNLERALGELRAAGCRLEQTRTPEGAESWFVHSPYGFVFHLWEKRDQA
ncbi:MAG: VOC family protein [Candidatus Sericytochromatia bacterium]